MKVAHVLNGYKIYFLSIQQESYHSILWNFLLLELVSHLPQLGQSVSVTVKHRMTQKPWHSVRVVKTDITQIQRTAEATSFAGTMVSTLRYISGEWFNRIQRDPPWVQISGQSDNSTNILGHTGDKYFCAPGLAWHQRLLQCDWPYNLAEDEPCYQPLN